VDDLAEVGASPTGLQQQVMCSPQRQQAALDGVLRVFGAGYVALARRGDGTAANLVSTANRLATLCLIRAFSISAATTRNVFETLAPAKLHIREIG